MAAVTAPGRRRRLELILDRDGPTCVWCGCEVDTPLVQATTEHVVPRLKGGPSWLENEVAACKRCNGRRGHRNLVDWADECDGSGWNVDDIGSSACSNRSMRASPSRAANARPGRISGVNSGDCAARSAEPTQPLASAQVSAT